MSGDDRPQILGGNYLCRGKEGDVNLGRLAVSVIPYFLRLLMGPWESITLGYMLFC